MITLFKKNSYRWSPLALILIIILGCVSLPDAISIKAPETASLQPVNQLKFTKMQIPNRISGDVQLSPDGKSIALVNDERIWIMPRSSRLGSGYLGVPRLLDTAGVEADWSALTWSADGRWIAFNGNEVKEGYQRIYVVSTEGGEPKQVHENNRDVRVVNYRMSLSSNGETLAFTSVDGNELHIYTMSIDGGSPKRLVDAPAREPVFSPDGKMIAYVEDEGLGRGGGGLWIVPADGGTPITVAEAGKASSPVWSPDGKIIAFLDYRSDNKIFIVPIAEDGVPVGPKTAIDCPQEVGRLAGWTRDNEIGALFDSQQEFALYTQPIQGGMATFVTHGGYPTQPHWSPDGKLIIHTNDIDEASGDWQNKAIAYVSAEGGDVTTIPLQSETKVRIWGYGTGNRISPDGEMIVFAGQKPQEGPHMMHIWTLPIDGGTPRQLTNAPVEFRDWYPCWSPDGQDIAFVRMEAPETWAVVGKANICVIPADGGEPRQITSESDRVFDASPVLWSPDGKLLAYFSRDKDDAADGTLKVIPAQGGEPRIVTKVQRIYANKEMAWSPDGKRIAYNAPDNKIKIVSLDDESIEEIEPDLKEASIYHLDWSPDGENLVFAGYTGGGPEFWVIENFLPETTIVKPEPEPTPTLRQIEVRGRGSVHSKPSFDGKYMLDVDQDTGNLVIRDIVMGNQWNLKEKDPNSDDLAYWSSISPDSTKVIYYWYNDDKEDFDLRAVALDGSGDRLLWGAREGARSFNMDAWSPDSKYIYGEFLEEKPISLVRVSVADGSREVIKTFDEKRFFTVSSSPDGRYIAYDCAGNESPSRDIFIYDLEQKTEDPLIRHEANDKLLGWTPDGRYIFFSSDRNGTWDGWLQRVEDGKPLGLPNMIKAGIGDVSAVGFTRSGSFYYTFEHEAWNVYTAKLDLDTGEVLSEPVPVRHVGKDIRPDWSPDGRYLAYLSETDSTKPQVIRIRTLATGEEREIKPDLPRFAWLCWCPDNQHLLITNFDWNSPSMVYKVNIETGAYTPLVESNQQMIRQAELSADGKILAYRIRGTGADNWIIIKDMETDSEQELLQTDGSTVLAPGGGWALSPDGKEVAVSIREGVNRSFVLKIISIESGESRTLAEDIGFFLIWSSNGRDVFFTRLIDLWRVSASGGEKQKLWEWEQRQILRSPRIHPDGQRIAFFSGGYVSEMWVMENFLPKAIDD